MSSALLFLLIAVPAAAGAQGFAISDLAPPNVLTTCPKFRGGAGDTAPSALVPSAPAAGSASAQAQQAIDAIKQQLATMKPGDPGYAQIKEALAKVDQVPTQVAQAEASANAPAALPVEYVRMDFAAAMASVRTRLQGTVSPKTWAYYQANQAINDPAKANTAAIIALVRANRLAATAALLRTVERNPKDVTALVNLAALMAVMGAPNESLALLAEADRLGTQPRTAWNLNASALKLNIRGYALMGVGNYKEAETVLRQSASLEPQLAEAKRNLAAALGEQGKCAEGMRILRRGAERNPPSEEPPAVPPPPSPSPIPASSDNGYKPARDVLDFSHGQKGANWPHFPVIVAPENQARIRRLLADYKAFNDRLLDPGIGLAMNQSSMKAIERVRSYFDDSMNGHLTGMWVSYLVAESVGSNDRVLQASDKTWRATEVKYLDGEKTLLASLERKRAQSRLQLDQERRACNGNAYCTRKADYDDDVRVCSAVRDWNDLWRGSIAYAERSARARDDDLSVYYSTLTSYFSDPVLQARPKGIYRVQRAMLERTVSGKIYDHMSALQSSSGPCIRIAKSPPPAPPDESIGDDEVADMPGCSAERTAKGSLSVKVVSLEISGNCEKMGVELAAGADLWIFDVAVFVSVEERPLGSARPKPMTKEQRAGERAKGFNPDMTHFEDLQARKDHRSNFTVFVGGKAALGTTEVVGGNVESKAGVYFTQGPQADAGAKIESSSTQGVEFELPPGKVAFGVETAGPEASVSFAPDNGL